MVLKNKSKSSRTKIAANRIGRDRHNKNNKRALKPTGPSSRSGLRPQRAPKFDLAAPKQDLAVLEDDAADFEKFLSESGEDDESEAEFAAEEAAYLEDESDAALEITKSTVKDWEEQLASDLRPMKHIMRAMVSQEEVRDETTMNALVNVTLQTLPFVLSKHLPLTEAKLPKKSKHLHEFSSSMKQYCELLIEMLSSSDSEKLSLVLAAVQRGIPYFLSWPKLTKSLFKTIVLVVVKVEVSDAIKLQAFSFLQNACSTYPGDVLELTIRQGYEAVVRLSGQSTSRNLESINMSKNLFALLYSIDPSQGYQFAFKQLRTLAMHLKASMDKQKNPTMVDKVIYTWQYIHSLDFFSRVISSSYEQKGETPLMQLIHPLVQITLRVAVLVPSVTYFPLRFHLVRSLIRLSRHTGVFIPLAPVMTEVLRSPAVAKRGKKSTLKQLDFESHLRTPADYLDTIVFQNSLSDELVDLYAEIFVLYTKSIAFPELVSPVVTTLKRFSKHSTNVRLNKQILALCERLNANADYITKKRSEVSFGPRDKAQVAAFLKDEDWEKLPLGNFVVNRRKVREERLKLILAADNESEEDEDDLETQEALEHLQDDDESE